MLLNNTTMINKNLEIANYVVPKRIFCFEINFRILFWAWNCWFAPNESAIVGVLLSVMLWQTWIASMNSWNLKKVAINLQTKSASLLVDYLYCYVCPCRIVVLCLLLYTFFYTNIVSIFLFIRWSCRHDFLFCLFIILITF